MKPPANEDGPIWELLVVYALFWSVSAVWVWLLIRVAQQVFS